ncbi:MAG: oligosaccharide flippase family protein [Bacteroidales bacterium]|nr:oligosaccharide flippase family protein [Bacteroidales bacterium]
MKRKFVTNLILIILLNLLVKPLWIFGIDRVVQNTVGMKEFGFYGALLNFSFLLNILLDLGITNYNNRNISQNHQLLRKHFSNIVVLRLLMAVGYGLITFAVALSLGYSGRQLNLLFFLVLNQFLISFTLYLRSNIAGMQMYTVNSLVSVLDRTLMIIFCAVLIWGKIDGFTFSVEWFVYAQTAAYVLTTLICFMIVARKSRFPKFKFDRRFFMVILRQSFPFALLTLLMSAYTRLDAVLLDNLIRPDGDTQVGIYYHGFRIFDAAYQFALLFAVLLLPMFSKMLKEHQSVKELTRLSALLLFVPTIALAAASQVFRTEIMDILYTDNITESATFFGIIMTAFLGMAGTIIFGTLLTANGNLRILNITSAIALGINLLLNLILIPRYQAFGAAVSCLATQGFVGLSQFLITARKFRFGFDFRLLARLLLYISGIVLFGWVTFQVEWPWGTEFLGMIAASLLLAFLLKLVDVKAMFILIRDGEREGDF